MNQKVLNALGVFVFIAIVVLGIVYRSWQFGLCYPSVSQSWWYCFQHAWGGG